jgi:hypothetical protein
MAAYLICKIWAIFEQLEKIDCAPNWARPSAIVTAPVASDRAPLEQLLPPCCQPIAPAAANQPPPPLHAPHVQPPPPRACRGFIHCVTATPGPSSISFLSTRLAVHLYHPAALCASTPATACRTTPSQPPRAPSGLGPPPWTVGRRSKLTTGHLASSYSSPAAASLVCSSSLTLRPGRHGHQLRSSPRNLDVHFNASLDPFSSLPPLTLPHPSAASAESHSRWVFPLSTAQSRTPEPPTFPSTYFPTGLRPPAHQNRPAPPPVTTTSTLPYFFSWAKMPKGGWAAWPSGPSPAVGWAQVHSALSQLSFEFSWINSNQIQINSKFD